VGFPGETEEDFEDVLLLMEEIHFLYAFTYHYNPREGTAAFNMPDKIPDAIKQKRLERVMELQKKHTQQYLEKFTGQIETVLVTGYSHNNNKELITATERGMQAAAFGNPSLIGSFARLKTESFKGNTLRGFFVDV
ncbi:MAG: tRNA (N6-isopentenyl adenosine(37)-C2)-methylthiotransferase MiaB, partial [Spirochaetaceae bacterium]|nr:tRNA (N6-isopentenyl adenosine(37)-C2)-methylthiotransferase MiaB [Spirochaetaceae bacterium]